MTTGKLKSLFMRAGKIVDVFISKKQRHNRSKAFGFVRFERFADAMNAIKKLDGIHTLGSKIKVALAKFQKGGKPFKVWKHCVAGKNNGAKPIPNLASKKQSMDLCCVDQGSSQVLEKNPINSNNNNSNSESESVAVSPRAVVDGESSSKGNKNEKVDMVVVGNLPAPLTIGMQAVPKLSTVAGLDAVTPHPEKSETTQIVPTKKSKGKRAILDSKGIAEYLGYYTSGPSPAEASQKH
ncbi:unnamed protein product [Amaranthus hypochondriacus]